MQWINVSLRWKWNWKIPYVEWKKEYKNADAYPYIEFHSLSNLLFDQIVLDAISISRLPEDTNRTYHTWQRAYRSVMKVRACARHAARTPLEIGIGVHPPRDVSEGLRGPELERSLKVTDATPESGYEVR